MMFTRNAIQTLCRSSVFQVRFVVVPRKFWAPSTLGRTHRLPLFAFLTQVQRRTVTTLQETLMAQVPEKQAEMARLKKEHGSHV